MAALGAATPRTRRTSKESNKDLGLSASRAGARPRTRSCQKGEGQGGSDPWQSAPCPPWALRTPRRARLAKLSLEEESPRAASAPGCLGAREAASPSLPPCSRGTYFLGLPLEECHEPAAPSRLLLPPGPAGSRDVPRKTRSTPECTLALELDGTLLYSSLQPSCRRGAVATFSVDFQGDSHQVYLKLRPHLQQFLESVSKIYEIFIFTTAKQDYAEKLLDVLDPKKKFIRHCLSQQDCVCAQGCYWKDLSRLDRDLTKTVVLDHTIQGFPAQAANWMLVPRWRGDPRDTELLELTPLLAQLSQADDVRSELQQLCPHRRLPAED